MWRSRALPSPDQNFRSYYVSAYAPALLALAEQMRRGAYRKQPLAGKRAMVAMRPEELTVSDRPAAENSIAGRVDNVEYSGRDALLDVVSAAGTRLHVRGPVGVRVGDAVYVHVPVERALVYPVG